MRRDLGVALRRLRRAPTFTATALLTIALTVSANVAIFAFADAITFRPLPYPDDARLCILRTFNLETGRYSPLSPKDYLQALESAQAIQSIGERGSVSAIGEPGPEGTDIVGLLIVGSSFFDTVGVRPAYGRLFNDEDTKEPGRSVVLTYAGWRRHFESAQSAVGRTASIAGQERDVIGVLPPDFMFPVAAVPLALMQGQQLSIEYVIVGSGRSPLRGTKTMDAVVRVKRGYSITQAQAELDAIHATSHTHAASNPREVPRLVPVRALLFPNGGGTMFLLLMSAGAVLILGCANLVHLFLSRTALGLREAAIRAALGATRSQLVRETILEGAIVGVCGAVIALWLTGMIFASLLRLVPAEIYGQAAVGIDWRAWCFGVGLGLLAGLLIASIPAWQVGRGLVHRPLGAAPLIHRGRFVIIGRVLMFVQVTVAIVLGTAAVIAGAHSWRVARVPLGFTPDDVVIMGAMPRLDGPGARDYYVRTLDTLMQRHDVVSVGATDTLPLSGTAVGGWDDVRQGSDKIATVTVLPGYFESVRIRLLRGRTFARNDLRTPDYAVLNQSASRRLFPDAEAIGQSVHTETNRILEVIGVVSDTRMALHEPPPPLVFALPGERFRRLTLVARVNNRMPGLPAELKRTMSARDANTPVVSGWWEDSLSAMPHYRLPRFQVVTLGSFAGLAVVLGMVGVFGIVSFWVSSRKYEWAVRLAVGATTRALIWTVCGSIVVLTVTAVSAAALIVWVMSRFAQAHFDGFAAAGIWPFTGIAAVMAVTVLLCAYIPARRAAAANPLLLLRQE